MTKLIKLYTLNACSMLYICDTSIKLTPPKKKPSTELCLQFTVRVKPKVEKKCKNCSSITYQLSVTSYSYLGKLLNLSMPISPFIKMRIIIVPTS